MPAIIEVLDLVKRYRGAEANAVDGISFKVAAGDLFVLLGPNGAGKTTTISILTTTLAPTAGTVRIAGFDADREASRVRREVGIIFQRPSLDVNLTAEENVRFHAVLYGLYPFRPSYGLMPRAYKRQVEELAGVLGLGRELFQPIKTFSGGMMRKLEIIRSLIHRPRVLFLDEPTIGLDPASRRNLWQYIHQVRGESGTTVFLTTHYIEEAEGADQVCVINRGKIVALGTPAELRADLTRAYLVVDAADRAGLRAELAGLGLAFEETGGFRLPLDGRSAHAILRSIETPLTVVQTHAPSLEDAYLAIVGREEGQYE
ncbi:MAG TPA: ATP-binding cassette domain-containing protein [Chloroflexota bacterium]